MKMDKKLTPEQIANWRQVLSLSLGSYAFMMSDKDVQRMRDKMQNQAEKLMDEQPPQGENREG